MHPFRVAYCRQVLEMYDVRTGGDRNPERTEILATKVRRLGLSYTVFMELALTMWDDWCAEQGHEYPYWNIVTSDTTFNRIASTLRLTEDVASMNVDADLFALELQFALDYVDWMNGNGNMVRPTKSVLADVGVKMMVAEHMCQLFGVPYINSNYNYIASQVARS